MAKQNRTKKIKEEIQQLLQKIENLGRNLGEWLYPQFPRPQAVLIPILVDRRNEKLRIKIKD